MAILHTFKLLVKHPLTQKRKLKTVFKFIAWQLLSKILPYPIIYNFTTKAKLIVAKGMTGATGNLYVGLHEFEDMAFLLHFLREDDVFIDAGANVGSYTVLASAHVGCKSISVEPVPSTFQHLVNNIAINHLSSKVKALNIGLGSQKGKLQFTHTLDTVNHIATIEEKDTISVLIQTIDDIVENNIPSLIKIDVEGYETEVLKGANSTLSNPILKAIIIELNGSGGRYGFDEKEIHATLTALGFKPYLYLPFERKLVEIPTFGSYNTIYIRDIDFVKTRLDSAPMVEINKQLF
jgi:FkbM family methyltransferase